MNRLNTNFQTLLTHFYYTHFQNHENNIEKVLQYHQFVIYLYIKSVMSGEINHQARGLVINQPKGSGKTIISISIANILKKYGYEIIILGPKILEGNYYENLYKFEKLVDEELLSKSGVSKNKNESNIKFHYLSSNSSNVKDQIIKAIYGKDANLENLTLKDAFKHKAIFIEEAHALTNSVTNGSKQALDIYNAIMDTKDCFVFPITGSLLLNEPFELVPMYNMVIGKRYFPENYEQFNEVFGTVELINKNRLKLQNMVSGLTSYNEMNFNTGDFPIELKTKIIKLEMKDEQLARYVEAKESERLEAKRFNQSGNKGAIFTNKRAVSGTYAVKSRQASAGVNKWNWLTKYIIDHPNDLILIYFAFIDEGGIGNFIKYFQALNKNYEELIIDINGIILNGPEHLVGKSVNELEKEDQKNISKPDKSSNIVIDELIDDIPIEGDDVIQFDLNAYKKSIKKGNKELKFDEVIAEPQINHKIGRGEASKRYYIIFSGEVDVKIRNHLIKFYKLSQNKYGELCHLFLISPTGGVGIDLFNIQHVISTSVFWVWELWKQFIARAQRYLGSHALPENLRKFQPIILVSTEPTVLDENDQITKSLSTEEEILKNSLKKNELNTLAIEFVHGVTIEALAGVSNTPKLTRYCVPNNKQLTTGDFWDDKHLPSPCIELDKLIEKDKNIIKLSELKKLRDNIHKIEIMAGSISKEFFYFTNPIEIYEMIPEREIVARISPNHPLYNIIYQKINQPNIISNS